MGKRIIWIALCAFVGLALSFAGLSSARTGQNSNSSAAGGQGNANRNDQGGNMNGGGPSGAQGGGQSGGALSSQDRKFVANAAIGDMLEIESSRLALERAPSDAVKQMAQRLIDDHTRTSAELTQLAQSKGTTPPAALAGKHAAVLGRLRNLSGAEFEREYVRRAGVRAHEEAVKLFRDQSRKGRDADLRAFAARTLPALEGHLQMARGHGGAGGTHGGGHGGMTNSNDVGGGGTNSNTGGAGGGNSNRNANRGGNSNASRGNTNNSNR